MTPRFGLKHQPTSIDTSIKDTSIKIVNNREKRGREMMSGNRSRRGALGAVLVLSVGASPAFVGSVGAQTITRTKGTGSNVNLSWTEYDRDDVLGLPGNVHVGFLYADAGPYGSFIGGNVFDFDCDEGETPFGGHGFGHEEIVDEASDVVEAATEDVVDEAQDTGAAAIDLAEIGDAIQSALTEEIPDVVAEESLCDHIGVRFLSGDETAIFSVDSAGEVATITGRLIVSSGGHGDPGEVLGNPPVNITITGGEWNKFEYSSKYETADFLYADSQKGQGFYGGVVTGAIGAMGFADDDDDESFGGFSEYAFKTTERLR